MSLRKYTYNDIRSIVSSNGGLTAPPAVNIQSIVDQSQQPGNSIAGTAVIDLGPYQDAVLALKFDEETDQTYDITVTATAADPSVDQQLAIDHNNTNTYTPDATGGSIFLNSNRIVINAKDDYSMLFGEKGVAIASPNQVNIDAGKTITLFGRGEVFLGLPNRGKEVAEDLNKKRNSGKTVGDPTPDELYEPLLLGLKLVNLIEDLISSIQNMEIASPTGISLLQPSSIAKFELLKVRLPEILSNYAYVDGISHEQVDLDRLKVVQTAAERAVDFVPPRQLTGTVSGTATLGPTSDAIPSNPVSSPYKDIPGYYNTPESSPYGDPIQ